MAIGVNKARLDHEVKTEKTADSFHFSLKYTSNILGICDVWDDLPALFPRLWNQRVWSAPRNYWALKTYHLEVKKMKKIQILGTGCPKCMKLTANAQEAAKQAGIEYEIEKVTEINKIMNFGVMMTPALAIDGEVKSVGKVLSAEEIKKLL